MPIGFKPTPIGERRHRIRIQVDSGSTRGADGHITPVWTLKQEVWAKILQRGSREFNETPGITAQATHALNIRYLPGVNSKMRATVVGSTQIFNFDGVDDFRQLHREQNISAIEVR